MAAPGWYRDPGSDRLARWFDGQEWTLHTVVMADWRGRGSPPPPEDRTIVQSSSDAYVPPVDGTWAAPAGYEDFAPEEGSDQWATDDDEPDDYVVRSGGGYRAPTLADRYREGPPWFRFGAPALMLLIVLVAAIAIAGGSGDDDGGDVAIEDGDGPSLDDVIDIAYEAGFPEEVSEARVGSLIKLACEQVGEDDGAEVVAAQIKRFNFDGRDQSGATDGLRAGGEAFCEDKVEAEDPDFFREVALLVSGDSSRSSTTTSTTRVAETTSTTTKPATTTTKKPTPRPTTPSTAPSTTSTTSTTTTTLPGGTDGTTDGATDGGDGGLDEGLDGGPEI